MLQLLDRVADIMTFGALLPCEACKGGQLVFSKGGYLCSGDLTEWSKCKTFVKEPKRVAFKVPKHLIAEHTFLKKYKYVPKTRVIKDVPVSVKAEVKKEDAE